MSGWLDLEGAGDLLVVPAIDLLDGRVVRLLRGRYEEATTYDRDPADAARRFADAGTPALHVVDLDGAKEGAPVNLAAVERIAAAAPAATVQLGGGIRSIAHARAALAAGVDAVIVGSRAAVDPTWVGELVDALGADGVIGSLDLRGDEVAVEGWTRNVESGSAPRELVRGWIAAGLRRAIVTDTERDGTLTGARSGVAARFADRGLLVAAAGGVAGPDDLDRLAAAGLDAAVVGRALYEGRVAAGDLADRGWHWPPAREDP